MLFIVLQALWATLNQAFPTVGRGEAEEEDGTLPWSRSGRPADLPGPLQDEHEAREERDSLVQPEP